MEESSIAIEDLSRELGLPRREFKCAKIDQVIKCAWWCNLEEHMV